MKRFVGTVALDGMDFEISKGEVHAIVGENGAGKSTLMKILAGVYTRDSGSIQIDGHEVELGSIDAAAVSGIVMIHQELSNLPKLSVAENIFLGRLPANRFGLIEFDRIASKSREYFERFGIDIDVHKKLGNLTVAEKQIVEIIKATQASHADIIIMDEPTSSLSSGEVKKLFSIIEALVKDGKTIIYISHRLDEISEIADRVSVFRDGKNRGVLEKGNFRQDKIIELMIGHSIDHQEKTDAALGDVVLEIKNLNIPGRIKNFDMELRRGEILGIAGLMGSGKDALVKSFFGLWPTSSKEIRKDGKPITISRPSDAIRNSIVYMPEERKIQALFLESSVGRNISPIWIIYKIRRWLLDRSGEDRIGQETVDRLSIKTSSLHTLIKNLSGGNQQKAVFGRLLLIDPEVMVLNDPTRGVDIGSKEEIYREIRALADAGTSIIIVSSELAEVELLANRVIVLSKGEIRGRFSGSDVSMENLLLSVTRANHG
ncbi:MAG: sugar ABC transporter ATP-binding protein [Hyphomicrobiales bacterium]|nr:sugar ABC transporter ATP-binding protein [Hyphomicrobiales bacterium]